MKYICGYWYKFGRGMYVMQKRGAGGKDWGYTAIRAEALPLTERMMKIYLGEGVPGRFAVSLPHYEKVLVS